MSVSKYQKFEIRRMWRSEFTPHPNNPRKMAKSAKHRLKTKIEQVGVIDTIVVNVRTKMLVGGHQRISIIDRLERFDPETKKNDYQLDVACCDLDEKQELEMLAFLGNPAAQGEFDLDVLADLNLDQGVSFENMGFSQIDVDFMYDGDARFSQMMPDPPEVEHEKDALEKVKAARADGVERMRGDNDAEFYFVVVCRDQAEMNEVKSRLGVQLHEQFVSGDAILGAVPE